MSFCVLTYGLMFSFNVIMYMCVCVCVRVCVCVCGCLRVLMGCLYRMFVDVFVCLKEFGSCDTKP